MGGCVIQVPAELFALAESSRFEGEIDIGSLVAGPDDYRFDKPARWEVDVTNTGAAFLVSGTVRGVAVVACSRCLEEVSMDLEGDIEGYFLVGGGQNTDPDFDACGEEPGADEFDVLPADHRIDLEPLIKAALLVEVPQMPLCSEDCAGLCPVCGANLNDAKCTCGKDEALAEFERVSNPFASLADFKFE